MGVGRRLQTNSRACAIRRLDARAGARALAELTGNVEGLDPRDEAQPDDGGDLAAADPEHVKDADGVRDGDGRLDGGAGKQVRVGE